MHLCSADNALSLSLLSLVFPVLPLCLLLAPFGLCVSPSRFELSGCCLYSPPLSPPSSCLYVMDAERACVPGLFMMLHRFQHHVMFFLRS
ncbi:hypothetical protein DL93DRAFT_702735 [Clavulina sp. PMI_390]|nr:hypothetical protein DL93DRAFT_702735 [Clavulina sp. PMI_390]